MAEILYLGSADPPCPVMRADGEELSFSVPDEVPPLAVIDLSHPRSLDVAAALREYFTSRQLPIWAFGKDIAPERETLFFALGGDRKGSPEDLWSDAADRAPEERDLSVFDFPFSLSLSARESTDRLIRNLQLMHLRRNLAGIPRQSDLFDRVVSEFFRIFDEVCHPHIMVLLFSSHLTVEAWVRPADQIFREDYLDFRSFCLSDFFAYFKGVDLENPEEHIFLGDRKDFAKISMDRQKISSYLCLPLKDQKGRILGTFHFGHLSNHYFTHILTERIGEVLSAMEVPFSYTLHTRQTLLRQQRIFQIFSRFVPADIIPQLVEEEKSKSTVKASKREITVLFCDIRSFTTITESNGAQQVVEFLNRHFDAMVGAIEEAGGSIDKFIGDAIVAFFGVPQVLENSGKQALHAAMNMVRNLKIVDVSGLILPEAGYSIGVGLHRGEAIVGNIGSQDKSDYTAIGDVIGIAEELEAMTKEYPGHILASPTVFQSAGTEIPMKLIGSWENGMEMYIPLWEDTEGEK